MERNFASTLLENAVNEFAKLPGIGRKTALRLVLHLLRQDEATVDNFGNAIMRLRHDIKYCKDIKENAQSGMFFVVRKAFHTY